ncbi:transcriptional coactivator p15/PC4 family protein [Candidatus Bipolaricaulota bacterium]|nr:transcriptional coactivator p15/PC4 family protein [Candidatus Bipolaricaulota bacterium]
MAEEAQKAEAQQADEKLVKVIDKGMGGRIHIRLSRFRDRDYLDIRNFYETDEQEWKPTRKGIAIPVELHAELLAALKEAEPHIAERAAKSATP